VARRARITGRLVTSTPLAIIVEASHDGYRRLPGRNMHRRRWVVNDHSLRIEDEISGEFTTAAAYFHIHPEVDARIRNTTEVVLNRSGGVSVRVLFTGAATVELLPSTWHPRFGEVATNRRIVARFLGATLVTNIYWTMQ
jgi:uncharacterized heparinase superfamily protein